ncbi:MAG: universal stress protein [Deltaproteobacteria bacterium]|nr:universal stress protein [Deltaproteobacteria bacterium]MBW1927565.1 universal stress protein [Deltaproteobacteria bacterium]MBW2024645.1 universal stress protein [Deltaproteobacteria bacterium]MBW2124802.1 universal stress protein [Deltaproteobacteria bacterium]RLB22959.1 MAG: hypothetical protein DRG76_05420 [Deltaproteobacteria bacterium]
MAATKVLVPYNFTTQEEKALDFVINTFSQVKEAKITLFNAYPALPSVDMSASPELSKMKGPIASLSKELTEREEALKSARQYLLDNGFDEDRVDYVFKERKKSVAEEIADLVTNGHYRVVVLSRQPVKVTRLFGRGIHAKLLSTLKNITICIAT